MEYVNTNLSSIMTIDDLKKELANKQERLVGDQNIYQNIKQIDGQNILGQGNIETATLTSDLITKYEIGGIRKNYEFPGGYRIEDLLREMLAGPQEVLPINYICYDVVDEYVEHNEEIIED